MSPWPAFGGRHTGCAPTVRAAGPTVIPELAGGTRALPTLSPAPTDGALRIATAAHLLYEPGADLANRLVTRGPGMDRYQILVVEPFGSQYCRGDRVNSLDPVSHLPGPACILGDFVPYSR